MTNRNNITSSLLPFMNSGPKRFSKQSRPTNRSYCPVLFHLVPFFWYWKAILLMPGQEAKMPPRPHLFL